MIPRRLPRTSARGSKWEGKTCALRFSILEPTKKSGFGSICQSKWNKLDTLYQEPTWPQADRSQHTHLGDCNTSRWRWFDHLLQQVLAEALRSQALPSCSGRTCGLSFSPNRFLNSFKIGGQTNLRGTSHQAAAISCWPPRLVPQVCGPVRCPQPAGSLPRIGRLVWLWSSQWGACSTQMQHPANWKIQLVGFEVIWSPG